MMVNLEAKNVVLATLGDYLKKRDYIQNGDLAILSLAGVEESIMKEDIN